MRPRLYSADGSSGASATAACSAARASRCAAAAAAGGDPNPGAALALNATPSASCAAASLGPPGCPAVSSAALAPLATGHAYKELETRCDSSACVSSRPRRQRSLALRGTPGWPVAASVQGVAAPVFFPQHTLWKKARAQVSHIYVSPRKTVSSEYNSLQHHTTGRVRLPGMADSVFSGARDA